MARITVEMIRMNEATVKQLKSGQSVNVLEIAQYHVASQAGRTNHLYTME